MVGEDGFERNIFDDILIVKGYLRGITLK